MFAPIVKLVFVSALLVDATALTEFFLEGEPTIADGDENSSNITRIYHYRGQDKNGKVFFYFPPSNASMLTVKDNHKPVFTNCSIYRPSVDEEQPVGTYVFTITAVDRDPIETGGKVTYTLVSSPGEKEKFTVEPDTGRIHTNDIFDHDEPSRDKILYITVRATDNGHPKLDDACTIKITIVDINDNQPVFDKVSYSESVPQDLAQGREVMRISATDIDEGNNSIVHYALDANSPDFQYFYIDPDNGVIYLNKTIDKPPGYKFRQNAIVQDRGVDPQQSSIALDIQVVESNKKRPSFIEKPSYPIRVKENYSNFTKPIAILRATSNMPQELIVNFELVTGQTEQTNKYNTFILESDNDTAFIKLGNLLDYEKTTEYTLTVRIQNFHRLAAEATVEIEVEDVNDNIPIFSEIRSGSVLENEPPGAQVMQVQAHDADGTAANNQITYELADPMDPFDIDAVTGNITTLIMFDRENKSFYNIKVIATDNSESALIPGKHNVGQKVFQIEIADKNDNSPRFGQRTYVAESIAENANINELVTQVTAKDIDAASVVTYRIVTGNTYDAFVIKPITGEIRVNKPLDYENITDYDLDIQASDGKFEDFCKVIIKIDNINDNPPVFYDNYTRTIKEETLYDGCILQVSAYDPDIKDRTAPQNINYSLVKLEQREFLSIDKNGCLRLLKPLDRDPPLGFMRWQILIMAADKGGPPGYDSLRSTTEVTLELTDINDNAPFLTNIQPVILMENQPAGFIVELTAKDNDTPRNGPPFSFILASTAGYDIITKFAIRGNKLLSLTSFDREFQKLYIVPIQITDSGVPNATSVSPLTVIIGDANDNAMRSGHSDVFIYNYKGDAPDTEIGRTYVIDPDDWDLPTKRFMWLPSYEERITYFDINDRTGMITMKQGTPEGSYHLTVNVTEFSPPIIKFHWCKATINVTVKNIPEEAVKKSGSIRFFNTTAEDFIAPEGGGYTKKDRLTRLFAKVYNTSTSNVDIFTVASKVTVNDVFLDIRYSVHGSPYYAPEKLDSIATGIQEKIERLIDVKVYMFNIDECLIESEQCSISCRNRLTTSNVPLAVYTNRTSFIGVSAMIEADCTCEHSEELYCLNGGTPFADKCECPDGLTGPHCEATSVGFHGDGWAMYPPLQSCNASRLYLTVTAHTPDCLIFYTGPLMRNRRLDIQDFMALQLKNGYFELFINYGAGTTSMNNSFIYIADGKPHKIEIGLYRHAIEMYVDECKMTSCMSITAPVGRSGELNVNAPLQLGGSSVDLVELQKQFNWTYKPSTIPLKGCISNLTYNKIVYNLGQPAMAKNIDPGCQRSVFTAVTFSLDTNFWVVILVCVVVLIALLLAVVIHRRKASALAVKELDDIRENIIAYADEGGGEGDAGYDLQVLRQIYDTRAQDRDLFLPPTARPGPFPDISGFLDDKKSVLDAAETNPYDNVRLYAYEGDGDSSGSLSSLASCTDDGDLKFSFLATFGPRFRKIADIYSGGTEEERAAAAAPHEESWC